VKKEILLVTSWPFPHVGGVSSHLELLSSKLGISKSEVINFAHVCKEMGMGPRGLIYAFRKRIRKAMKRENISLFAEALATLLSREHSEIVHCHDAMATWAALRAKAKSREILKIVSTVHGPVSRHMIEEGYSIHSPDVKKVIQCEKVAWNGSDAIIAVDQTQAEIIRSQGGEPSKISVIPNAVDIGRIEQIAASLRISRMNNRPWVLIPRRLSLKNGVEFAIQALACINPRPLLLLAGNGQERERLELLVTDLELGKDVIFLGNLEHNIMIPLMAACDVVIIPSVPVHGIEEATSIAALEAMALRKPVIASAIGGLKEMISNGDNGVLVPPTDINRLAHSISTILNDPATASQIGKNARQTVEERFSADHWFAKHMDVYLKLLS
jgi:glycosyltransferase involved in cell wall biosynthesis